MSYSKEYQEYVKKITDIFISIQSDDNIPSYIVKEDNIDFHYKVDENYNIIYINDTAPDTYDEEITHHPAIIFAWRKIASEYALKWLNKNMITYEQWFKKL